jgi:hypothetical protein
MRAHWDRRRRIKEIAEATGEKARDQGQEQFGNTDAAATPPPDKLVVCHGDAARRIPCWMMRAAGPATWTSACSASPAGGLTWPSPPGAPSGTSVLAGTGSCSTLTESAPTLSGPLLPPALGPQLVA